MGDLFDINTIELKLITIKNGSRFKVTKGFYNFKQLKIARLIYQKD